VRQQCEFSGNRIKVNAKYDGGAVYLHTIKADQLINTAGQITPHYRHPLNTNNT
jgi:hypothetical protein